MQKRFNAINFITKENNAQRTTAHSRRNQCSLTISSLQQLRTRARGNDHWEAHSSNCALAPKERIADSKFTLATAHSRPVSTYAARSLNW